MNDGKLLLRAILEDPLDDTLRLVYADWLDERAGRATQRSELIRLTVGPLDWAGQIEHFYRAWHEPEAYLIPPEESAEERARARVRELLCRNEFAWLGPWWPRQGSSWRRQRPSLARWWPAWSRGFVSEVRLTRKALLMYGARLFAAHPILYVGLWPRTRIPDALWVTIGGHMDFYNDEGERVIAWGPAQAGLPPLSWRPPRWPLHTPRSTLTAERTYALSSRWP